MESIVHVMVVMVKTFEPNVEHCQSCEVGLLANLSLCEGTLPSTLLSKVSFPRVFWEERFSHLSTSVKAPKQLI